jgi:sulfatase maturation enzyme AslB (radical SAM superfamily)
MITVINSNHLVASIDEGTIKSASPSFAGWSCASGITNLNIYSDGTLYGNACRSGGSYGNIYGEYTLPISPSICDRSTCYCGGDIKIPKGKSKLDLEAIIAIPHSKYKRSASIDEVIALKGWDSQFTIDWNLGKRCNYSCSYCPSFVHDNSSSHLPLEVYKNTFDKLYKYVKHHKSIILSFLGGEPTLNPDYSDILAYSQRPNISIVTTTNGTAHIDKLIAYKAAGTLNISIHQEYVQNTKIISKIKNLVEHSGKLSISYMLKPGNLDQYYNFLKACPPRDANFIIEVCPLVDRNNNNKILSYNKSELQVINNENLYR